MLLGAMITLLVTVIGGLLVYYFTQNKIEQSEELWFEQSSQTGFSGSENTVAIGVLKFGNSGNASAEDVNAIFGVASAKLLEFKVINENGAKVGYKKVGDQQIEVFLENLLSGESVTITYLLDSRSEIDFKLRSDSSMGKEGNPYISKSTKKTDLLDLVDRVVSIAMFGFTAIFIIIAKGAFSERVKGSGRNNMGFVLLHSGAYEQASEIFRESLKCGKDGELVYSNYAATLALQGEFEDADKFLRAAEYVACRKRTKAILAMNKSIIYYHKGDMVKSKENLNLALSLSENTIKEYVRNSFIFSEILKIPEMAEFIDLKKT